MALRAARGSEALLGISLDGTSDIFNVGHPALTAAGDNYGFRYLQPDSFSLAATYQSIEQSGLTGTAFRGRSSPGVTSVAGEINGSIRTGSAVPAACLAFGDFVKTELVASYAYQYVWTTAAKNSPRSGTAQTHKGGSLTPELFYGLFANSWKMSIDADQPGKDTLSLVGHHHTTLGIGYKVAGTGTFAGVLAAYGIPAYASYLLNPIWVKVTSAPTLGTLGVKMKTGNAASYSGAEKTVYYNTTSKKQTQGGSQVTDRFIAYDEAEVTLGLDTCSSKADVGLLFTGDDLDKLALNDEFVVMPTQLIPGAYTVTNLVSNGTFTGAATSWTLGTGWAYNSNNILHTAGNTAAASQNFTATSGVLYRVQFTVGGAAGTLTPSVGAVNGTAVAAGAGAVTQYIVAGASGSIALAFTPTTDFDGTLDTVVLEPLSGTGAVAYTGDAVDYITGCKLTGAHVLLKKDSVVVDAMKADVTITTPHERRPGLGAGGIGSDVDATGFWGMELVVTRRLNDRSWEYLLQTDDRFEIVVLFEGPILLGAGGTPTAYRNTLKFETLQNAVITTSSPVTNENVIPETITIRVEAPDAGTEALTCTCITAENWS